MVRAPRRRSTRLEPGRNSLKCSQPAPCPVRRAGLRSGAMGPVAAERKRRATPTSVRVKWQADAVKKEGGGATGAAAAVGPTEGVSWAKHPMKAREQALKKRGFMTVAGVDEAGRGPLAGPVVAAACIVEDRVEIAEVMDSKKITTEEQRESVFTALEREEGVNFAYAVIDHKEIDRINILQATLCAMEQAVEKLATPPSYIVVDGNRLPKGFDPATSEAMVKGDSKCYAVAAASIVAKVVRDRIMHKLDRQYPEYGFKVHKGYGVPAHKEAIYKHGPSPVHRRTFAPVKHMV